MHSGAVPMFRRLFEHNKYLLCNWQPSPDSGSHQMKKLSAFSFRERDVPRKEEAKPFLFWKSASASKQFLKVWKGSELHWSEFSKIETIFPEHLCIKSCLRSSDKTAAPNHLRASCCCRTQTIAIWCRSLSWEWFEWQQLYFWQQVVNVTSRVMMERGTSQEAITRTVVWLM